MDIESDGQNSYSIANSRKYAPFVGAIVGGVFTPVALFLSVLSGGAGHGDFGFAKLFYPIPVILMDCEIESIIIDLSAVALIFILVPFQYVIIGYLVGHGYLKGNLSLSITLLSLGGLHLLAVISVFFFDVEPF